MSNPINIGPPVRVLHLITELTAGGAQSALLRLLTAMKTTRFQASVACYYQANGSIGRAIAAQGIPVVDLNLSAKWRADGLWRLFRHLRHQQPQILHTWLFHANIPGRILGRLAGVPVVVSTVRSMGNESWLRGQMDRATVALTQRVICVSEGVREFAEREVGLPSDKLTVIPNGITVPDATDPVPLPRKQARADLGVPPDGLVVGTIGRAHPDKGQRFLLDAARRLCPRHPNVHFLVAGGGPDLTRLRREARRAGLENRVTFLGHRDDVSRVLSAMDVFALPSVHEGMPNALLEAMAAGLPVVATRVGGVVELVRDGETGILVPPSDVVRLARAIESLLAHSQPRQAMGRAGQHRARTVFSLASTVAQTVRLYEGLLGHA